MTVSFNHFPELIEKLHSAEKQIVAETARAGEANVKGQIQANGQVRTGFMLSSVYSVTSEGSTYGQASTPPKDASLLPEAGPANETTAYFGVAASYAIYPNYGTRFQSARPFWEPGIEKTRADFQDKFSHLEDYLR